MADRATRRLPLKWRNGWHEHFVITGMTLRTFVRMSATLPESARRGNQRCSAAAGAVAIEWHAPPRLLPLEVDLLIGASAIMLLCLTLPDCSTRMRDLLEGETTRRVAEAAAHLYIAVIGSGVPRWQRR